MQEIKEITIEIKKGESKVYCIKELTLNNLIELSQTNSLLGGGSEKEGPVRKIPGLAFVNKLIAFRPDVESILKMSCNFTFEDLLELPPSDIKILFEGFQEVNQVFLEGLEKLGVLQMLKMLIADFTEAFSK